MTSLTDLLAQRAEIERQITEARRQERADAIAKVRALMTEHGLTVADLTAKSTGTRAASGGEGRKVAAKYRDPASGQTWTGRGLKPKWITNALESGRQLSEFEGTA